MSLFRRLGDSVDCSRRPARESSTDSNGGDPVIDDDERPSTAATGVRLPSAASADDTPPAHVSPTMQEEVCSWDDLDAPPSISVMGLVRKVLGMMSFMRGGISGDPSEGGAGVAVPSARVDGSSPPGTLDASGPLPPASSVGVPFVGDLSVDVGAEAYGDLSDYDNFLVHDVAVAKAPDTRPVKVEVKKEMPEKVRFRDVFSPTHGRNGVSGAIFQR